MTEKQIRNKLHRMGFHLCKGRDAYGVPGYMISNANKFIIEGYSSSTPYTLGLEDVENWILDYEKDAQSKKAKEAEYRKLLMKHGYGLDIGSDWRGSRTYAITDENDFIVCGCVGSDFILNLDDVKEFIAEL